VPVAPRVSLDQVLHLGDEVEAIGAIRVPTATLDASWARDDQARDALDLAAHAAAQIFAAPRLREEDDEAPREALVVSPSAVHAFVQSALHPTRVIVGIARGGASVGLLLASVRALTGRLEGDLP
jgi:hypothetical protein